MADFDKDLESEYDKIFEEGVSPSPAINTFNDDIATRKADQELVDKILSTDEKGMGELFVDNLQYNYLNIPNYLEKKKIRDEFVSGENSYDQVFEFWKSDVRDAYMQGLPETSALAFEDVISVREADYVRDNELNRAKIAEDMSMKHGFKSGLLSFADPMMIAPMIATGGLGAMIRTTSTAGRLAKYNGLVLAEELAYEAGMDLTVESYEANYGQTAAISLAFANILAGSTSAYSKYRSKNNRIDTENETDINTIKEEINSTEVNVEEKAFKANNPNVVGKMSITYDQVKNYTVEKMATLASKQTENINNINNIKTQLAELKKIKVQKEKGIEAQLLEKNQDELQKIVDDLRVEINTSKVTPDETSVFKSKQRLIAKLEKEGKVVGRDITEIDLNNKAFVNAQKGLKVKINNIRKDINKFETKLQDNISGKKSLSTTEVSTLRKDIDLKNKEVNDLISTPSADAIQARAAKILGKKGDVTVTSKEMKDIMAKAAKTEKTVRKTQLTKKRTKLAKSEAVLDEFIKQGEKITETKRIRKEISNLSKDIKILETNNKNLNTEIKRYKQKLQAVKANNGGDYVDTKALQNRMANSLIEEYNQKVKDLDPDEVALGIHDTEIPPDVTKDGGDIIDDTVYSGEEFADEVSDILNHGTVGAANRIKPEFMRTFGAKIVNSGVEAIRDLGLIIQTSYRKNADDGSQLKNVDGVTLKQEMFQDKMRDRFFKVKSEAINNYRKNGGDLKFDLLNDAFNAKNNNLLLQNDIALWVRGERDVNSFGFSDKNYLTLIEDIGKDTRKMYEDIFNQGKKSGHEYFEDMQTVDDYITRQYMEDPINDWNLNYDYGDITEGIKKAIEKSQPNLIGNRIGDKEVSGIFANALWKTLTTNIYGLSEISHLLNGNGTAGKAFDTILEQLKKQNASDSVIDELEKAKDFAVKQIEKTTDKKRRILLDENMSFNVRKIEGGETVSVKMSDLLLNNNDVMMESYIDKMSGFIMMGEQAKKFNKPELAKMDYFEVQKKKALEEIKTIDKDKQGDIELLFDTLESQVFKRGNKHYDEKSYKIASLLSSITYALQLGSLPISMAQELSKVASYGGFKLMLKVLKEKSIGKMFNGLAGEYDNKLLADDMEFLIGSQDTYIYNLNVKGGYEQVYTSKGQGAINNALYKSAAIARKVNRASGARAMHKWVNQVAFKTQLLRFANLAKEGKLSDKMFTEDRLLSQFLDANDMKKINSMFKKYGKYSDNGSFRGLDWAKWNLDDSVSLNKFSLALKKGQKHMVQVSTFDELPVWMQHPMMKVAMNLRSFSLQELSTTLDFNVNFKDLVSINTMLYTIMAGGLSYYAMVNVNALGREDADEYREKFLDSRKIMAASIARAGWTMPLVAAVDTVWGVVTGGNSSFSGTRTSGNATGGLNSIPIANIFNNLVTTVQEVGGAVTGQDPFTAADAKRAMGMFPGASMIYVKPAVNYLADKIGED